MGGDEQGLSESLGLIQRRWPQVFAALDEGLDTFAVERVDSGPEATLRVDGLLLTSGYNRLAEAQTQAQLIPDDATEAWVYGAALGDLPRVLLERPQLQSLHVVLLSVPCARASFRLFDHTDWLADDRVSLELGWEASFNKPFAAAPTELKVVDGMSTALRDQVLLELSHDFQAEVFRTQRKQLQQQTEHNFLRVASDGDAADLFGTASGMTAVVVAAGPTLDAQLDWLQAQRESIALFAVTTALRPLAARGIYPDVAVVVDPKLAVLTHFEGLNMDDYAGVPLVYVPSVQAEVLDAWRGPRLSAYIGGGPTYAQMSAELPRAALYCSGTVTHAAVDLAVKAGAQQVVLAGVDFAYPSGRGHAAGAADNDTEHVPQSRLSVPNGRGESVPTDARMIGFLRDLERYIAQTPDVTFIHAGRDGAQIAGTVWREEHDAA